MVSTDALVAAVPAKFVTTARNNRRVVASAAETGVTVALATRRADVDVATTSPEKRSPELTSPTPGRRTRTVWPLLVRTPYNVGPDSGCTTCSVPLSRAVARPASEGSS